MENNELYNADEKRQLLLLARSSMEAKLKNEPMQDISNLPEKLNEIASCFVTLHTKSGALRGCIGNIGAYEPLTENVTHNAANSAFNDPRFPPVASLEELARLEIEISVLTAPKEIALPEEFIVGEHGVILSNSGRSAVFLPQVAPEQGWSRDTTLAHLSMKAGMASDAWREPETKFSVFKAIVFSEKDIKK